MKTRTFNATESEVRLMLVNETGVLWRAVKQEIKYDVVRKADGTYFDGDMMDKVIDRPLVCPFGVPGDTLMIDDYITIELTDVKVKQRDSLRHWVLIYRRLKP